MRRKLTHAISPRGQLGTKVSTERQSEEGSKVKTGGRGAVEDGNPRDIMWQEGPAAITPPSRAFPSSSATSSGRRQQAPQHKTHFLVAAQGGERGARSKALWGPCGHPAEPRKEPVSPRQAWRWRRCWRPGAGLSSSHSVLRHLQSWEAFHGVARLTPQPASQNARKRGSVAAREPGERVQGLSQCVPHF